MDEEAKVLPLLDQATRADSATKSFLAVGLVFRWRQSWKINETQQSW